jgi:hypothetical protein
MDNSGQLTDVVVLHWDAEAPGDRAWWLNLNKQAVTAADTSDGWEITVGNSNCYRLVGSGPAPTMLEIWNCAPTNPLNLGYLQLATAKLVTEVPWGSNGVPVPDNEIGAAGFSSDGTEAAVMVNGHYWAWKGAAGRAFDLGPGAPLAVPTSPGQNGYPRVAFSPDGRWIAFERANDPSGDTTSSLVLHDTSSDTEQILTAASNSQTPVFSADSTRLVFYGNYPQGTLGGADLVAFDLAAGTSTTLATDVLPSYLPPTIWSTAGGRHLLFAVVPEKGAGADTVNYGHLDAAGKVTTYGNGDEALAAPDLSFVAFETIPAGDVMVLDDAADAPHQITVAKDQNQQGGAGGLHTSPDSKYLAFADIVARTVRLYQPGTGALTALQSPSGCVGDLTTSLAGQFLIDGSGLVYASGDLASCGTGTPIFTQMSLHLFSGATDATLVPPMADLGAPLLGPLGAVVYGDSVGHLWLYEWKGSAQDLGAMVSPVVMTNDQRYLVTSANDSTGNPHLFVRDVAAGTNIDLGEARGGNLYFNPATGVMVYGGISLSNSEGGTLYFPTGETTLLSKGGAIFQTPSRAAVAYADADNDFGAVRVLGLDTASSPVLIENGSLVGLTEHLVMLRAPDGICVYAR